VEFLKMIGALDGNENLTDLGMPICCFPARTEVCSNILALKMIKFPYETL
jgi:hypothetical protein